MKRRWRVRASDGHPEEWVEVEYEQHEYEFQRLLARQAGPDNPEALNCIDVFHEIKALIPGARMLTTAEQIDYEREHERPVGEISLPEKKPEPEPEQTTMLDPDSAFGRMLPPSVRERMHGLSDPDANTPGKFHTDAEATEWAAAFKVTPRTGTQRRLVLDFIARSGERGATDEEIAASPGVADTAHRTRRNELVMGGWVVDSGMTRRTASESDSIVWVLSGEGRLKWSSEEAA